MISVYQRDADGSVRAAADCDIALTQQGLVWIDLEDPSSSEEERVETALGVEVLTAGERTAYEESARFYTEQGSLYLTVTLLGRRDEGPFVSDAVTFILTPRQTLITVRNIRPRAFSMGAGRASARIEHAASGADVLVALLEGCIERIADLLQESNAQVHQLSASTLSDNLDVTPNLRRALQTLGRLGGVSALAHDSLSSLQRATAYAGQDNTHGLDRARLAALRRDIEQLERAVEAFQNHLTFLQEAILGLVGVNQNNTLKVLSIATVAFVPPTLVASIFGMNFKAMTWFDAPWGPWVGFLLILLAPGALFAIAMWRKWF